MLTTPLGTIGTITLRVARVVQSLCKYTPLGGSIVAVIKGQILLHRPAYRAMVKHDVLDILNPQGRHTALRQVASTETDMAHNDVGTQLHTIATQTDTTTRSCLTCNGRIRLNIYILGQIDGATYLEQYCSWGVVSRSHCPAKGTLLACIGQACDIVDLRTASVDSTSARGKASIALTAGEGNEVGFVVLQLLEDGINGTILVQGKRIGSICRER